MSDRCQRRRCRGEAALRYLGRWLCWECWMAYCTRADDHGREAARVWLRKRTRGDPDDS